MVPCPLLALRQAARPQQGGGEVIPVALIVIGVVLLAVAYWGLWSLCRAAAMDADDREHFDG